jgi:alpha/beta superfamily hydrolase
MVGSAAGKWTLAQVPADTILIHGELDETIPLIDVLDWARPQELTVQVVPGADHFFHRRLHCIRNIITSAWLGMPDHRK